MNDWFNLYEILRMITLLKIMYNEWYKRFLKNVLPAIQYQNSAILEIKITLL